MKKSEEQFIREQVQKLLLEFDVGGGSMLEQNPFKLVNHCY